MRRMFRPRLKIVRAGHRNVVTQGNSFEGGIEDLHKWDVIQFLSPESDPRCGQWFIVKSEPHKDARTGHYQVKVDEVGRPIG